MLITDAGEAPTLDRGPRTKSPTISATPANVLSGSPSCCEEDLKTDPSGTSSQRMTAEWVYRLRTPGSRGPFKKRNARNGLTSSSSGPVVRARCVVRPPSLLDDIRVKKCYWRVVPHPGPDACPMELERAYTAGYGVKNCFLCRYHAQTTLYQWELSSKPVTAVPEDHVTRTTRRSASTGGPGGVSV